MEVFKLKRKQQVAQELQSFVTKYRWWIFDAYQSICLDFFLSKSVPKWSVEIGIWNKNGFSLKCIIHIAVNPCCMGIPIFNDRPVEGFVKFKRFGKSCSFWRPRNIMHRKLCMSAHFSVHKWYSNLLNWRVLNFVLI